MPLAVVLAKKRGARPSLARVTRLREATYRAEFMDESWAVILHAVRQLCGHLSGRSGEDLHHDVDDVSHGWYAGVGEGDGPRGLAGASGGCEKIRAIGGNNDAREENETPGSKVTVSLLFLATITFSAGLQSTHMKMISTRQKVCLIAAGRSLLGFLLSAAVNASISVPQ